MKTEQHNWREFFNDARLFKYSVHETINLLPIFKRLAQSRPRNEPALGPAVHFTGSIVVRVEQVGVLRVYRRVVRQSFFKNKGLEKPTRVREMPFRGAHLGHRLDDAILGFKRLAEFFAQFSNATIGRAQVMQTFAWLIPGCSGRSPSRSYRKGRHDQDFSRKEGPRQRQNRRGLPGAKSFLFVGLVLDCAFIVTYPAGFDPAKKDPGFPIVSAILLSLVPRSRASTTRKFLRRTKELPGQQHEKGPVYVECI
jgi:hypothetical protein